MGGTRHYPQGKMNLGKTVKVTLSGKKVMNGASG